MKGLLSATLVIADHNGAFKPNAQSRVQQTMHVIEIKPGSDMPQQVADFFKKGGEQTALDSTGILTRNWLWIQIVGGAGYVSDNLPWIKELWKEKFYLQRVKHKAGEKVYVVFKGNPALRSFLSGTRYAATHAKVLAITAGAGTAAGLRHAAWEGAKGAVKKGGALTVVFATVINVAEWLVDYEERDLVTGKPKKDFFDLVFKIGVDIAKAVVSAALGAALVGGLIMVAGAIAVAVTGVPLLVAASTVVVGSVVAAVAVGIAIDLLDKKSGVTENLGKYIKQKASYLEEKMPRDYAGYSGSVDFGLAFGIAP